MTLTKENAPVIQLGLFKFQLYSKNQTLLDSVSSMFEPAIAAGSNIEYVDLDEVTRQEYADLDTTELHSNLIDHVINLSYSRHQDFVYLDAALLVSPQKTFHLLVGKSHSGKTTSSLSLCLSKEWKILSEDISYISFPEGKLYSIVRPLSIREPTWELIESQLSIRARALVAERWLKCPDLFCTKVITLSQVQSIFVLSSISPSAPGELEDIEITPAQCLHYLLPLSNLLRIPSTIPQFTQMIANCKCFLISGGTLKQRVETIVKKASTNL